MRKWQKLTPAVHAKPVANVPNSALHARNGLERRISGKHFVAAQTTERDLDPCSAGLPGCQKSIYAIDCGLVHGPQGVKNGRQSIMLRHQYLLVLGSNGLMAKGGKIENGEPAIAETDFQRLWSTRAKRHGAGVIRPAMRERTRGRR
jgi:hypothetical protein